MLKKITMFLLLAAFLAGCSMNMREFQGENTTSETETVDNTEVKINVADQPSFSSTGEDLPDYYYNYYLIKDKAGNRTLDMATYGTNVRNVYGATYHGRNNQQWLIMPVYPGSDRNYIVNRYNAGIMNINRDNNIGIYDGYATMENKQIFRLNELSNNNYLIDSPFKSGCFNMSYGNLIYYPSNNALHQRFYLTAKDPLSAMTGKKLRPGNRGAINNIPEPSPYLTSRTQPIPKYSNTTLIGETYIPFVLVNDPAYGRTQQMNSTPYYKLVREQAWEKVDEYTYIPNITSVTDEYTIKSGISKSHSETTQSVIETGWTANGSAQFKSKLVDANIGLSFQQKTHTTTTIVDTYSTEDIVEAKTTVNYTGSKEVVRMVIYQLVDKYSLQRTDPKNTYLIKEWLIYNKNYVKYAYYAEKPQQLTKVGNTTYIKSKSSTTLPATKEVTAYTYETKTLHQTQISSYFGRIYGGSKSYNYNDANYSGTIKSTGFSVINAPVTSGSYSTFKLRINYKGTVNLK